MGLFSPVFPSFLGLLNKCVHRNDGKTGEKIPQNSSFHHLTTPSNILGVGSDIVEIERIRAAYSKHGTSFLDRLFSKREQEYCEKYQDPVPRYAGRFAAKEAIVKALGIGVNRWSEIEVINNEHGKPEVFFSPELKKQFPKRELLVTISHCQSYATATALALG